DRPLDQPVEDRVLEGLPPRGDGHDPRAHARLLGLAPRRRHRDVRPAIVRPDGAAGEQPGDDEGGGSPARPHDGPRAARGRPGAPGATPPTALSAVTGASGPMAPRNTSSCWPTYRGTGAFSRR